jgi:hypothetical protein
VLSVKNDLEGNALLPSLPSEASRKRWHPYFPAGSLTFNQSHSLATEPDHPRWTARRSDGGFIEGLDEGPPIKDGSKRPRNDAYFVSLLFESTVK